MLQILVDQLLVSGCISSPCLILVDPIQFYSCTFKYTIVV